jgi:sigma-B regulation protein RsbU (phosphoserine phosphatase)
VLNVLNEQFAAVSLLGDFVSMILLRVEPQANRLQYASAGHEPGWLISSGDNSRELTSTGLLLGIDEEAAWEEVTIETTMGDRLFVLTDGVSETFNSHGETFGRTRLSQLFTDCRDLTSEQTVQRIDESLAAYRGDAPQHDDVTVVLLELTLDGARTDPPRA